MHREGEEVHLDTVEARGGDTPGIVRYVLLIGLGLAILVLSIVWISAAISLQPANGDPVTAEEHALGG
jgi:hypothetical protein